MSTDPDGTVHPMTGGMSVCPRWQDLKHHQIPRWLHNVHPFQKATGGPRCRIWSYEVAAFESTPPGSCPFAEGLTLRGDSPGHGLVEPAGATQHSAYSHAIAATRAGWRVDEPNPAEH